MRGNAFLRKLVLVLFAVMLPCLGSASAMALSESQLNRFAQNNILFYNPEGMWDDCITDFYLGDVAASGEFNENGVFIIAYLISQGYSAESAAAIVGNLKGESGAFNPGEGENGYSDDISGPDWRLTTSWKCYNRCGFGIAQWTSGGRQLALQSYADEKGMPVTSLELQTLFLIKELKDRGYGPDKMNAKTLEEATFTIYRYYETPSSSFKTGEGYNNYDPKRLDMLSETETPAAYKAYMKRLSYAYGALEVVKQNNLASISSSGISGSGGAGETAAITKSVTIIGDSITERSKNDILAKIPGADIYSQSSKQFYSGTSSNPSGYTILSDLVAAGNLGDILVFALGTNGSFKLSEAQEVAEKAGKDTEIIFVNNYATPGSGYDFTSNNNIFAEMASDYNNVSIANWDSAVSGNPSQYMEDAVHPIVGAGTELFAKTIYDAVNEVSGGGRDGDFNICSTTGYNYDVQMQIIDGIEYVFPLAGATKSNYLNPGWPGPAGDSVLSRLPCGAGNSCHHDYHAVDLGLRKKLIDGTEYTAADFPDGRQLDDLYYYSTGVKVLAFVGGEITSYKYYTNKTPANFVERCASVMYKGVDGKSYWIGHMSYDPSRKAGDTFNAGEVIGEIGPPQCAQETQAHVHIDERSTGDKSRYIIDLMDMLYEGLPN